MKTKTIYAAIEVPEGSTFETVRYLHDGHFYDAELRIFPSAPAVAANEPVRWLMSYRGVSALDICQLPDVVHSEKRAIEIMSQVKRAGHDAWYEPLGFISQPVAMAEPIADAQVVSDEVGWLIENGRQFDELRYRFIDNDAGGVVSWTPDHAKALRFARRADAEQFCHHDEDAWRVVEHMWCGDPIRKTATSTPLIDEGGTRDNGEPLTCEQFNAENGPMHFGEPVLPGKPKFRESVEDENGYFLYGDLAIAYLRKKLEATRPQSSEPMGEKATDTMLRQYIFSQLNRIAMLVSVNEAEMRQIARDTMRYIHDHATSDKPEQALGVDG